MVPEGNGPIFLERIPVLLIKVVFDKASSDNRLNTGWGFSCLAGGKILFDTGGNGEHLLENLRFLGVDADKIEAVVISHDHWDHWGGLWDLLRKRKGLRVYICPNFSREFKDKAGEAGGSCVELGKASEIAPGIFSTGEIAGSYDGKYMAEQALVLKTTNGISVITGCAHPGIITMLENVKNNFPGENIHLVMGGFHLKDADKQAIDSVISNFLQMKVALAGPAHCSGDAAEEEFKKTYLENFISVKAGDSIEV